MFKKAETKLKNDLDREKRWIWVDGYKGTDKDMKCRDYQYEIGKVYDMPDDTEIEECKSGFHLCLNLKDVFNYYSIGCDRRFFRVRALVREEDVAEYDANLIGRSYLLGSVFRKDKLVARSIVFVSELTDDEILADTKAADLPDKYKKLAMTIGINQAISKWTNDEQTSNLINLGYCEPFARYIVEKTESYQIAYALGYQKDLSMDMKAFAIMADAYKNEKQRSDSLFKPSYLTTAGLNHLNGI